MIVDSGEDTEKGELVFIADESKTGMAAMKISVDIPQEAENQLTTNPSYTVTLGHPKNSTSFYRDTRSSMFIAPLLILNRNWKQPRCPPINGLCFLHSGILFSC